MALILTSDQINFTKMLITFAFSVYMIFAFKAMTKFMLNYFYPILAMEWPKWDKNYLT